MTMHLHLPGAGESRRMRLAALTLLGVPAGLLVLLGLGEMMGGNISGIQHVPEAALLLALLWLAWRYPWPAGTILVAGTALLFTLWLLMVTTRGHDQTPLWAWLLTGLVVFVPPLAAGVLLLLSSRDSR